MTTAAPAHTEPAPTEPTLPEGMHQLSPHLVCAGAAEAIAFYEAAFGATELVRLAGPDGKLMHACSSTRTSSTGCARRRRSTARR